MLVGGFGEMGGLMGKGEGKWGLHCILEFAFVEALDFTDGVHGASRRVKLITWEIIIWQSSLSRNEICGGT